MAEERRGGLPKAAVAGIIVVIVGIIAFVVYSQRQKFVAMVPGTEAFDFTLPDLEGSPAKLSDMRGKVVFLNFWATWCPPCKEEMPSMQALYDELKGRGLPFEILAVSIDKDEPAVVKKFVDEFGLTFKVVHDRKGEIKDLYKTTGVPETYIVDQNGIIAEKVWGPRDWENPASTSMIMELLEKGPRPREAYKKKKNE